MVLQTPYGIANSAFTAVGRDHKLSKTRKAVAVKSDMIEFRATVHWRGYPALVGLKGGRDFERIDVEAVIHSDGHFILIPTAVTMRGAKRPKTLEKVTFPLSFHRDYQSKLWKRQIEAIRHGAADDVSWAGSQLRRIVADHRNMDARHVHEADLLRAAGALSLLGFDLSLYLTKGYDCPRSCFNFSNLPPYRCPVEIKKRSSRFDYQITRYTELPRAVVLCVEHDLVNPPDHVDVVELAALAEYLAP